MPDLNHSDVTTNVDSPENQPRPRRFRVTLAALLLLILVIGVVCASLANQQHHRRKMAAASLLNKKQNVAVVALLDGVAVEDFKDQAPDGLVPVSRGLSSSYGDRWSCFLQVDGMSPRFRGTRPLVLVEVRGRTTEEGLEPVTVIDYHAPLDKTIIARLTALFTKKQWRFQIVHRPRSEAPVDSPNLRSR